MRKKLVASRQLPTDHKLERDDVALKAPGDGLAPYHLEDIIQTFLVLCDEDKMAPTSDDVVDLSL